MSLLLDALKKAAEQKAKKQAENGAEQSDDAKTEILSKTQVDVTESVEKTRMDTKFDKELDKTQLVINEQSSDESDDDFDPTEVVEKTRLDTKFDHDLDKTEQVDKTQLITEAQSTVESDDEFDPTEIVEKTRMDTNYEEAVDKTVFVEKASLESDSTQVLDDEKSQLIHKPDSDEDDDATVLLTDDDITQFLGSGESLPVDPSTDLSDQEKTKKAEKEAIDKRAAEAAQRIKEAAKAKALAEEKEAAAKKQMLAQKEAEEKEKAEAQAQARLLQEKTLKEAAEQNEKDSVEHKDDTERSEDTRVTPLITNTAYRSKIGDITDKKPPPDPASLNKSKSNISGSPTQTQSEIVNIETLTNEDTVIRKDTTSTGTFAPDNYDRTLINVAGRDISQLFPGMKSDSTEVMTPDHAKKVFVKNSTARRIYSYKIYAGIGAFLLLLITVLSLFETQQVFDKVDTDLMPLRRDPMPGLLRAKKPELSTQVKLENVAEVDENILQLIKQEAAVIAGDAESVELPEQDLSQEPKELNAANTIKSAKNGKANQPVQANLQKTSTSDQPEKKSSLSIASNLVLAEKDILLLEAYNAYESGDDDAARQAYSRVLDIDPENRDALLGMAALYIKSKEPAKAIVNLQRILLQNPKDTLAMTSLISIANIEPEVSETQLKLLLREQPDSPYLHFALGNVFGAQDRWREAQEVYFQALKFNPDNPNYAYNFAVSLEHISKSSAAIPYYERALKNSKSGLATFNEQIVVRRLEILKQL